VAGEDAAEGGAGPSPERRERAAQAALEARVREGVASLLFVELLFWKGAREAEAVREQYHWQARALDG
jgi:hypothetical protein